jgi:hypothetical protein
MCLECDENHSLITQFFTHICVPEKKSCCYGLFIECSNEIFQFSSIDFMLYVIYGLECIWGISDHFDWMYEYLWLFCGSCKFKVLKNDQFNELLSACQLLKATDVICKIFFCFFYEELQFKEHFYSWLIFIFCRYTVASLFSLILLKVINNVHKFMIHKPKHKCVSFIKFQWFPNNYFVFLNSFFHFILLFNSFSRMAYLNNDQMSIA